MTLSSSEISEIDFNNDEDLKKVLYRDKHTRIEGLFAELFFDEQILQGKFKEITSGWWFGLKNNNYTITRFTDSVECLSTLDYEILDFFSEKNPATYVVSFSEHERTFHYLRYKTGKGLVFKNEWERLKIVYPPNPMRAPMPDVKERNSYRLSQAAEYLKNRGALRKSAIERIFANLWLGNAYFWDIDFFVKHQDKLLAFEIKQKFPTAKGTWGLNTGLKNLFCYLNNLGIIVIHVILVKPVKDASIPAIDLYMKEKYRKDAKWIATRFNGNLVKKAFHDAPNYTSIYGNSNLSYYHLKDENFSLIKKVASERNNILDFIEANIN